MEIADKKYFLPSLWDKDRNICTIGGLLYLQAFVMSGPGWKSRWMFNYSSLDWPFCVQKIGGADADGRPLEMSGCASNYMHQVWDFTPEGFLIEQERKFCMTLDAGNTAAGTNVLAWGCQGVTHQRWVYDPYDQTVRSIKDKTKCLTNASYSTKDGGNFSPLTIENCGNRERPQANQMFSFSH